MRAAELRRVAHQAMELVIKGATLPGRYELAIVRRDGITGEIVDEALMYGSIGPITHGAICPKAPA